MRLVTYESDRGPRAGVLVGRGPGRRRVGCARRRGLDRCASCSRPIASRELAGAVAGAEGEPLAEDALLPPVPDPEKILCIGLNYRAHAEETKQDHPRSADDLRASSGTRWLRPGATVELPTASEKVDYEAEVCVVIGTRLKEVGADEALAGVAGYTLLNDLSARDLQLATTQWISGKSFDGAAPCGPPRHRRRGRDRTTRSSSR